METNRDVPGGALGSPEALCSARRAPTAVAEDLGDLIGVYFGANVYGEKYANGEAAINAATVEENGVEVSLPFELLDAMLERFYEAIKQASLGSR